MTTTSEINIIAFSWRYDNEANEYEVARQQFTTRRTAENWMRKFCPSDGDCSATEETWDSNENDYLPTAYAHYGIGDNKIEWDNA